MINRSSEPSLLRASGGKAKSKNIDRKKLAKTPMKFDDPLEFGPNMSKSARKGDHFKAGGSSEHWIQGAIKNPGALRKTLGVKKGQKIPEAKLEKAENSRSRVTRKRANLAETLKKLHSR